MSGAETVQERPLLSRKSKAQLSDCGVVHEVCIDLGILAESTSGESNVDGRFHIQLEKDTGGSTRQSWVETSGLWTMLYWE